MYVNNSVYIYMKQSGRVSSHEFAFVQIRMNKSEETFSAVRFLISAVLLRSKYHGFMRTTVQADDGRF